MKLSEYQYFLIIGFALVIVISVTEGLGIVPRTISHIYSDLTVDLLIHLYILGWILASYGIYKMFKKS